MYQEQLIKAIQRKIGKQQSLIDVISAALDISYDAAHRRISKKSKFSMDEGVRLAHTFDLSLDSLFQQGEHVLVRKTREIQSFHDLANYLENSLRALQGFNKQDTRLYYSFCQNLSCLSGST
jgi:hypothetical protein